LSKIAIPPHTVRSTLSRLTWFVPGRASHAASSSARCLLRFRWGVFGRMTLPEVTLNNSPPPRGSGRTGLGFWRSKPLLSAIRYGLCSVSCARGSGAGSLPSVAGRPASPGPPRLLATLVALGFLTRSDRRLLRTPPRRILFLDRPRPSYGRESSRWPPSPLSGLGAPHEAATHLGLPPYELKGGGGVCLRRFMRDFPPPADFLASMTGISHCGHQAIAQSFLDGYSTFADGGHRPGGLARPDRTLSIAPDGWWVWTCRKGGSDLSRAYVEAVGVADRSLLPPGNIL